jgi:hypothetical protein
MAANPITITTIPANRFVSQTSRYIKSKVLYYGPNNILTFATYKRGTYPSNPKDRFMVISKTREYRPDLVSFEQYGTVSFWWKIMEANGMKDILEFSAGTNIRLPSVLF